MAEPYLRLDDRFGRRRSLVGAEHLSPGPDTASAALLRAVSTDQVAEVVLEEGCRRLGAAFGLFYQLVPGEPRLALKRLAGLSSPPSRELSSVPLSAALPFAEAVRSGRPILLESREALLGRYPELEEAAERFSAQGWVTFPIGTSEDPQGVISFGFRSRRVLGMGDRAFTGALLEQCTLALERARLYEAERRARQASERLQALTAALSEAATPAVVGDVIMRDGVAALGAYAGVMALETVGGEELEIAASIGYPAEACMSAGRRWPIAAPIPIAEATRTGEPIFVATREAWAARYQSKVPTSGRSAAWAAIPLRLHSGARGALLWTFDEPQEFASTERDLMLAIARQGTQALERAWLFEAETRARSAAERAVLRITRLQALTAALASALTPEQVARAVVEQGTAALGAHAGVIVLASRDGEELQIVDSLGLAAGATEPGRRFSTACDIPLAQAFRTGEPVILRTREELRTRYPHLPRPLTDHVASASVPLLVDGEAVGAMGLLFDAPIEIGAEEREFMLALGRLCAQAIRRAALYAQVEEANRAKADFLATMSHELRTPLNAVIGYQELLAEGITGPVTPPQQVQLQRIRENATHLLALIDEVLTYARVEAGTERVEWEPVELSAALSRAADLISPLAARQGLTLEVRSPAEPVSLLTDRGKLQQVLVNLLSNSVKFTENGSVELSARVEDERVVVQVADTGIGIAEEDLERIFEPFTQVESATTRRFGGTGLGLSVCRKLVRLLGGEISVRSAPGRGSTFAVSLPRSGGRGPEAGRPE